MTPSSERVSAFSPFQRRLTAEDKAVEDRAFAFVIGEPFARHLLPPETPRLRTTDESLDEAR